jgi:cytidine deaminase
MDAAKSKSTYAPYSLMSVAAILLDNRRVVIGDVKENACVSTSGLMCRTFSAIYYAGANTRINSENGNYCISTKSE